MSRLPLEGIRVLDITVVWAGPFATMLLGDLGAEVIRVESIKHFPTATRGIMVKPPKAILDGKLGASYPKRNPGERPWNRFSWFNHSGRNKLSMTLDLTKPKGNEIFKDLIKISDIFVENNAAAIMDRLGLSYQVLTDVKPDLIMVSMPAFGKTGPYKDYKGFAPIIEALSGHTLMRGYKDSDPSLTGVPVYHSDACSGATAAFAAMLALYHRNITGEGQFIDLSQAESMIPHLGEAMMEYTMNNRVVEPIGNYSPYSITQGCYRCKGDDRWVNITIGSDKEWERFSSIIGYPDWIYDERFSDILARAKNCEELNRHIEGWTQKHSPYEIMHLLQSQGICCGPVMKEEDALCDPHLKEREFFLDISHPEAGTHPHPGFIWKMSQTPAFVKRPAPCLGEHNDYVYNVLLKKSEEEIEDLRKEGHIGSEYLVDDKG
ncbi:MAG: CoA transferase [Thermodesulfobacteriota bacterium]|nr:CoA transferase [Thermodesulfobacteriota bacterium]